MKKMAHYLNGSKIDKSFRFNQINRFVFKKLQPPNHLVIKEKGDISVAQSTLATQCWLLSNLFDLMAVTEAR
jgi:hypothetical protein